MKLQSLHLENFQGVKDKRYEFKGMDTEIRGDNGTGKTTIFNAFTWLLLGESSELATNYLPKTTDENGEQIHNLVHAVEAVMTAEDGQDISFRRELKENYVKKRGSLTETFQGHTINYFIDGVPLKEKEFKSSLEELMGSTEQMKNLLIPGFFAEQLHWTKRREILLEMIDNKDFDSIIESFSKKEELLEALKKPGTSGNIYSIDEYKKVAAAGASKIKKDMEMLPALIDEAAKAIPDLDSIEYPDTLHEKIKEKETLIDAKKEALTFAISDDGAKAERLKAILDIKAEIAEAKTEYLEKTNASNEGKYKQIAKLDEELFDTKSKLSDSKNREKSLSQAIKSMSEQREVLYSDYMRVQAEQWAGDEICPTCSQTLPEAEIQKAKEQFNVSKAERLEQINVRGKECSKEIIAKKEADLENTQANIQQLEAEQQRIKNLKEEVKSTLTTTQPFEHTREYMELSKKLELAESNSENSASKQNQVAEGLQDDIDRLESSKEDLKAELLKHELATKQQERIVELGDKQITLAKDYEKIQQGLFLTEEFTKYQAELLTTEINNKFKTVNFKLFNIQINGGLDEFCEVLVPTDSGRLVEFGLSANRGAKHNASLEIIETLSKHWNRYLPVFQDNAESVTQPLEIANQSIRLIVSEADQEIRVELNDKKKRKDA